MKVLLVHNFYQSSAQSGEDAAYRNEVMLLKDKGIEIIQHEKHNDEISGSFKNLKMAFSMVWSRGNYQELLKLIKKEKPDIAHFHNIWYLLSPSAYYACKDAGIPVVQTLHNFRMFCANGLLLRDGKTCEACISKTPWRSIVHACYRDSRLYSVPVVASQCIHRSKKTWTDTVDAYITLTEFGKQKFIQCGLPRNKIFVKPNFFINPPSPNYTHGDYAIYLGRLSQEKGLDVLLEAVTLYNGMTSSPLNIKIVGAGPLRQQLVNKANKKKLFNIEFPGEKELGQCLDLLSGSRFLIIPSICYENFPMVIREAFACGKPVLASRLGAMAEIVHDNRTGLLFEPGNASDLAEKIQWMTDNGEACTEMGKNARSEFDCKYTGEKNFQMLMAIYRQTLEKAKGAMHNA